TKGMHGRGAHATNEVSAPAALFLDLTGCERIFGGIMPLVKRVSESLCRFGIGTRLAVAPTPGAAWALADAGTDGSAIPMISADRLEAALAPLPPEALRVGDDLAAAL